MKSSGMISLLMLCGAFGVLEEELEDGDSGFIRNIDRCPATIKSVNSRRWRRSYFNDA
jgi:hypothetical protein